MEATFTIKRSDFGMTYGVAQGSLGDEVAVTVGFACVKAK
jgi:polyisoprenoid-binding protein YceI